jgi:hypothetical protein
LAVFFCDKEFEAGVFNSYLLSIPSHFNLSLSAISKFAEISFSNQASPGAVVILTVARSKSFSGRQAEMADKQEENPPQGIRKVCSL